jgi:hypothetical protein
MNYEELILVLLDIFDFFKKETEALRAELKKTGKGDNTKEKEAA